MKINTSLLLIAFENTNVEAHLDALQEALQPFNKSVQKIALDTGAPPQIPRFIASSTYGHSNIVITNQSAQISTTYDDEYGCDIEKVYNYVFDKLGDLLNIVNTVLKVKTIFTGLSINIEENIENPVKFINDKFLRINSNKAVFDNSLKMVYVIDDSYFVNFDLKSLNVVKNNPTVIVNKLSNADIVGHKLGLLVDINDRYAYNQNDKFFTSKESAENIISLSKRIVSETIPNLIKKGEIDI